MLRIDDYYDYNATQCARRKLCAFFYLKLYTSEISRILK